MYDINSFDLDDVQLSKIFVACHDVSDVGTVTKFYWSVLISFDIKNAKENVCKTVNNVTYLNQKYSKSTLVKSETLCHWMFYTQKLYVQKLISWKQYKMLYAIPKH